MMALHSFTPLKTVLCISAMAFALSLGWLVYAQNKCRWFWLLISVFGIVVPVGIFLAAICIIGVNVPYWDDYDAFLAYLPLAPSERLNSLFAFHNEHRIMTTRVMAEVVYGMHGVFNFKSFMFVGNTTLLVFVALLASRFRVLGQQKALFIVPCLWMYLDMFNHENFFWALTSFQSHSVLLFALLALICLDRSQRWICFLAGLFFAFLCTFSSGAGVLIWPCMAGLIIADHVFRCVSRRWRTSQMFIFILVATIAVTAYFRGFTGNVSESSGGFGFVDVLRIGEFYLTFCGGASPFRLPALGLGLLVSGAAALLVLRYSRVRDYPVLFFLFFLFGAAASVALFRGQKGIAYALSYRYRVVAVSIFSSTLLLVIDTFHMSPKRMKWFCSVLCAGATALNLGIAIHSWQYQRERGEKLINNILLWPDTAEGLRYPDPAKAAKTLRKAEIAGVYSPTVLLNADHKRPDALIPW